MGPRRLIVDDRNINWKNQKTFDPVSDQQFFELSQIPFDKKIEYAARYFKTHCHDCYCRDDLVSPTSKYLFEEDDKSSADDEDDETSTCCTCPLEHPCILANQKGHLERQESPAPFLRSKQIESLSKRCLSSSCEDEKGFVRRRGTSCCEGRKNRPVFDDDANIVGCSKKSDELNYTKQRAKYELHNNPKTRCAFPKHTCNSSEATENTPNKEMSDFRAQHFFDTHNPFTTNSNKDASPTTNPNHHQCVYSFELNSRLKPIPLKADIYGNSCCDICNKRMRTDSIPPGRTDSLNKPKGTRRKLSNASEQEDCSIELDSQKIHIGSGNERIQLAIPTGLLEESIGHSVEVASLGGRSKGQGKKGAISWNNNASKGQVNPAERPNSFALRQQKFSMYSK